VNGEREVMDIRDAADYLSLAPDTLYIYASKGIVPAFKFGNRWRFKRSILDAWMEDACRLRAEKKEENLNASSTADNRLP